MVILKKTIIFQGFRGVPTFSRGGGGGGGGATFTRGVQMLISLETDIIVIFQGGSDHLSPPLDPRMIGLG